MNVGVGFQKLLCTKVLKVIVLFDAGNYLGVPGSGRRVVVRESAQLERNFAALSLASSLLGLFLGFGSPGSDLFFKKFLRALGEFLICGDVFNGSLFSLSDSRTIFNVLPEPKK